MARQLCSQVREPRPAPSAPALQAHPSAPTNTATDTYHDFKTRAGDANSSWAAPKHHQSSMKTHGPYNSTTTIIKIDNELKQEDTAALVAFFSFLFACILLGTFVYYGSWSVSYTHLTLPTIA